MGNALENNFLRVQFRESLESMALHVSHTHTHMPKNARKQAYSLTHKLSHAYTHILSLSHTNTHRPMQTHMQKQRHTHTRHHNEYSHSAGGLLVSHAHKHSFPL